MKKLIFFPIEIKSRELRPRLLMTLFALKKNFGCFVGDKQGILRATKHFSPGTYFYKSMNFIIINKEVFYSSQLLQQKNNLDQILKEHCLISQEETTTILKITDLQSNHGLMFVGKVLEQRSLETWLLLWVIISLRLQKVVMT